MARRNVNGEGTIYRRKDGRWEARGYFLMTSGVRNPRSFYGKTRGEARDKLLEAQAKAQQGIPMPDKESRLGDYLDHWLENIVRISRRPKTYEVYEARVRLNLKPELGKYALTKLSVPVVQSFLNRQLHDGHSVRKVQIMREVLSAALTRAHREELVSRNVARLVELPTYQRQDIVPWSAAEAREFLAAASRDPLYSAFILLLLYGLRLGEVLGLRPCDVDFAGSVLHIRQQLQRVGGALRQGPVKTSAGRRDLPLLEMSRQALETQRSRQEAARTTAVNEWRGTESDDDLVFTTRSGLPVEPRNLVRSFHRICKQHGIRDIKVHHLRHTAGTLLKNLNVPARDTQLILGHSQISVTQEIYQHGNMASRSEALGRFETVLLNTQKDDQADELGRPRAEDCRQGDGRSRQNLPSSLLNWWPFGLDNIWSRRRDSNPRPAVYKSAQPPCATMKHCICFGRFSQDALSSPTGAQGFTRATGLKTEVESRTRRWMLGIVAVNLAVKSSSYHPCPNTVSGRAPRL